MRTGREIVQAIDFGPCMPSAEEALPEISFLTVLDWWRELGEGVLQNLL